MLNKGNELNTCPCESVVELKCRIVNAPSHRCLSCCIEYGQFSLVVNEWKGTTVLSIEIKFYYENLNNFNETSHKVTLQGSGLNAECLCGK